MAGSSKNILKTSKCSNITRTHKESQILLPRFLDETHSFLHPFFEGEGIKFPKDWVGGTFFKKGVG